MLRALSVCGAGLVAAALVAAADPPKTAEETAKLIETGGKNWSAPAKAEDLDPFKVSGGDRLWLWPAEDKVIVVKATDPKITLNWRLRPNQKIDADEAKAVMAEFRGATAGSKFGFRGSVEGVKADAAEGTCTITPGPAIADYRGEGELVVYLAVKRAPASNLLRVKVKVE